MPNQSSGMYNGSSAVMMIIEGALRLEASAMDARRRQLDEQEVRRTQLQGKRQMLIDIAKTESERILAELAQNRWQGGTILKDQIVTEEPRRLFGIIPYTKRSRTYTSIAAISFYAGHKRYYLTENSEILDGSLLNNGPRKRIDLASIDILILERIATVLQEWTSEPSE